MRSVFYLMLIAVLTLRYVRPCSAADVESPRETKVFTSGADGYHTYQGGGCSMATRNSNLALIL